MSLSLPSLLSSHHWSIRITPTPFPALTHLRKEAHVLTTAFTVQQHWFFTWASCQNHLEALKEVEMPGTGPIKCQSLGV